MIGARKNWGSYRERIIDIITDIAPADFVIPWTFCHLLAQSEDDVYYGWRQKCAKTLPVIWHLQLSPVLLALSFAGAVSKGSIPSNAGHTHFLTGAILYYKTSFYLLNQCARFSGMAYKSTAVNCACFMREVFKEFFHNTLRSVKFQGTVKLDTPLFGRRDDFHKGNPNSYYYSIVSFSDFFKGWSDFSVQCIPFYHLLSNMASRSREIYEQWVWCKMQNIIGLAKEWPFVIRRLFWTRLASLAANSDKSSCLP